MHKFRLLAVVVALVLAVPLLAGCTDQLERENAQLSVSQRAAMQDLSAANARIAQLEEQIRFLQNDNSSQTQLAEKQAVINALQAEVTTLRAHYDKLNDSHQKLIAGLAAAPAGGGAADGAIPREVMTALRELQTHYGEYFTYDENEGRLRFASDVTFALGKADVSAKAQEALSRLADILKQNVAQDVMVSVFGHTDSTPVTKPETVRLFRNNQGLSEARAKAVADVLVGKGIAGSRITTTGFGDRQPLSPTDKAKNRRVEIYLTMRR